MKEKNIRKRKNINEGRKWYRELEGREGKQRQYKARGRCCINF
jgi:hypothetical protein